MLTDEVRAWIGRDFGSQEFLITPTDVAKFAISVGQDPAPYLDPSGGAKKAAPRSYYVGLGMQAANLVPATKLLPSGLPEGRMPALPLARAMAGESEARLLGDIYAGDVITVSQTLADIYEKQGRSGQLIFLVFARRYVNQSDELVVDERYTRIVR